MNKKIKNYSVQGLSLILLVDNKPVSTWLSPNESIEVEESQITEQIKNLHVRRLIQIRN